MTNDENIKPTEVGAQFAEIEKLRIYEEALVEIAEAGGHGTAWRMADVARKALEKADPIIAEEEK